MFLKPSISMNGPAFSQRMPPVQNITTVSFFIASGSSRTAFGNSRNVRISGTTAPLKVPSFTS